MKSHLLSLLLFLCFTSLSLGQDQIAQATQRANKLGEALLESAGLPGLSIAVLKDGKVIYAEGFGYADIENGIKVTSKTQFRTASVAKAITATAIGRLMQERKLDLDAPIHRYLPAYPLKGHSFTFRQLAGHISGMPHYSPGDRLENRFYESVSDGLNVFAHQPLKFEPGTAYSYSTHGYTLISAVIEAVSGQHYLDYMRRNIFLPLGMESTGPDFRKSPSRTMSAFYKIVKDRPVKDSFPEDPSYKWAGGGLISTPSDLVKMGQGYFDDFLEPAVVDTLFKTQHLISGTATNVGIGWRISQDVDGRMIRDHAGSMGGARSVVMLYPREKMAIAIMTNTEWSSMIEETAQMIMLSFLTRQRSAASIEGAFDVVVTSLNARNEKSTDTAKIILQKNEGLFVTSAALPARKSLKVFHIEGNRYAWVRPDGICYLEIEVKERQISGRAIAFGSRLDHNPLSNTPFVTFVGVKN
jgi:serine beta-lactamase-like protein LACTB, mitochondrial